jgi:D-3-phosphoglycerate dehydrogenase
MTARVLVTDPLAADGLAILQRELEVDVRTGLKGQELLDAVKDYDALIVRSETRVTAEVIDAGKRLQIIGRAGVGVDNIDVDAATQRGIIVVNAPTGNTISAAELTFGLLLAMARSIPQAHATMKAGQWRRSEFVGVELRHKTLGIVGLGRVGSELAKRARAFEMNIIAYDPFVSEERARDLGAEMTTLESVLQRSDFLSLHTPLTNATKSLITAKELAQCKAGVRIVNAARGGIVDEQALYDAVESGHVAAAAIDVFPEEPVKETVLVKSNRIIVTPHLGASTAEAQLNVAVDVAQEVVNVLKGMPARYAVNLPLVSPDSMKTVAPFLPVAAICGNLVTQLAGGQLKQLKLHYEGEIAEVDTAALKAAVLGGLLRTISEERVSLVNANLVAQSRGIRITEEKGPAHENYSNLVTVEAQTSSGTVVVSGTVLRGLPHVVQLNGYWADLDATSVPYLLLLENDDRPGRVGAVGSVLGDADINIAFMQVGRDRPRGRALMVLGLDEPISEAAQRALAAIPGIDSVRQVRP